MKSISTWTILTFLALSINPATAQRKTGEEFIPQKQLLNDLKELKSWITEAHGDPCRFTTAAALNQRFAEAERHIRAADSMTGMRFYGVLLPVMAELRDGHSSALPPDLDRYYGSTILPLRLHFFKEKPFVLDNLGHSELPSGVEITGINGYAATQFFGQLIALVHRDGNIRTSRFQKLESPLFLAQLMKAIGLASNDYKIEFRDGEDIKSVTLKGINQSTLMRAKRPALSRPGKGEALSLDFFESPESTALLTVASFNPTYFKNSQEEFERQLDGFMSQLMKKDIKHLIIDLRGNRGGEDTYYAHLLRYFMKHDFRLYGEITGQKGDYRFLPDGRHWDIDPRAFKPGKDGRFDATKYLWEDPENHGLKHFQPLYKSFTGNVYVLIDDRTFSAASELASFFKHHKLATLVGEETAGSAIGTVAGYTPTFTLKNSGVHINLALISIKRTFFDSAWSDRGVLPDLPVTLTVEDLLEGRDVVLEEALDLIRNSDN